MHIFSRPSEAAARALLASCDLPAEDLETKNFEHFFGCGSEGSPGGIVGVELLGEVALLRSLAVSEGARGKGWGKQLVAHAEAYAVTNGARSLYLLTTSAERFFESLGFAPADRAETPLAIRSTKQFAGLCLQIQSAAVAHRAWPNPSFKRTRLRRSA